MNDVATEGKGPVVTFSSTGENREINPGWPHFANYTFAPAILRDGFLFVSGMTAGGSDGAILCPGDIAGQTDVIFQRLGEILEKAGCSYADVVATREFVTTTDGYRKTGDVRRKYFKPPFPAATGVIVAGLLRSGALIEIEAIAAVPKN
jgi:enamine deaminase RidA (YjgF/YER057c/UK114 family)